MLWERCSDPVRGGLIAGHICHVIEAKTPMAPRQLQALRAQAARFEERAAGVLNELSDSAASALLGSVTPPWPTSILALAEATGARLLQQRASSSMRGALPTLRRRLSAAATPRASHGDSRFGHASGSAARRGNLPIGRVTRVNGEFAVRRGPSPTLRWSGKEELHSSLDLSATALPTSTRNSGFISPRLFNFTFIK